MTERKCQGVGVPCTIPKLHLRFHGEKVVGIESKPSLKLEDDCNHLTDIRTHTNQEKMLLLTNQGKDNF